MSGPKKHLSQNFLTSERVAEKVADAVALSKNDTVLEIGPGKGILTGLLLDRAGVVIAVEKDPELFSYLEEAFENEIAENRLILLEGDVLEPETQNAVFEKLENTQYQLVANIPYAITGKLLRFFLSSLQQPKNIAVLVQKEVAERITQTPPNESLLSISVKAYGRPRYLHTVKAGSFFPKPNVDSAVLVVTDISKTFFKNFSEEQFFETIRAGFSHKRKYVRKNIQNAFPEKTFSFSHISETARAQELSLSDWKRIFEK